MKRAMSPCRRFDSDPVVTQSVSVWSVHSFLPVTACLRSRTFHDNVTSLTTLDNNGRERQSNTNGMRDEGCGGGGEDGTGFFLCERCRVLIEVQVRDEVDAKDVAESRARRKAKREARRLAEAARRAEHERELAQVEAEEAVLQAHLDDYEEQLAADAVRLREIDESRIRLQGGLDALGMCYNRSKVILTDF